MDTGSADEAMIMDGVKDFFEPGPCRCGGAMAFHRAWWGLYVGLLGVHV